MVWCNIARSIGWRTPFVIPSTDPPSPLERVKPANQDLQSARENFYPIWGALKLIWLSLSGLAKALWFSLRACLRYLVHHPINVLVNAVLLALLSVMLMTGSEIHKQMILGKISDQTVDKIIQASSFTRDFDAVAAGRDGTREFQRVGAPDWIQRESIRAILYHARKAGLSIEDQAVLLATAEIESGFNPMARAPTTTACGTFQFVHHTGQLFELSPVECMNPWLNARSEIEHFLSNYEGRVQRFVTDLTGAERVFRTFELSYYMHHDGPNFSNPSNELKATVLSGTQFLFKVYHVLQQEADSEQHAPSFAQIYSEKLWGSLDRLTGYFDDTHLPSLSFLQRALAAS